MDGVVFVWSGWKFVMSVPEAMLAVEHVSGKEQGHCWIPSDSGTELRLRYISLFVHSIHG